MATNPARSTYRPTKIVRYGKGTRQTYNSTSIDSFFDENDDGSLPPKTRTVGEDKPNVKSSFAVEKAMSWKPASKQVQPPGLEKDTFSVPSSDEEVEVPLKRIPPPKSRAKPTLVDDTLSISDLAPWEKKASQRARTIKSSRAEKVEPLDAERQLQTELALEVARSPHTKPAVPTITAKSTSAAAKLAARRKMHDGGAHSDIVESRTLSKRVIPVSNDAAPISRKRARIVSQDAVDGDRNLCDVSSALVLASAVTHTDTEFDAFDLPGASEDEPMVKKEHKTSSKLVVRHVRGRKPGVSRSAASKGASAPARLYDMLLGDSGPKESAVQSPVVLGSEPSTPISATSERPRTSSSPQTAIERSDELTPRQVRAWDRILPDHSTRGASPSALPIKHLNIAGQRRTQANVLPTGRTLPHTSSDITEIPKKRMKLVDRLKAAASSPSSEDDSDEDTSDEGMGDIELPDTVTSTDNIGTHGLASQLPSQCSTSEAGPRVTYARVRSYLPEDSLEDAMALDLLPMLGRNNTTKGPLQKSAFDLADSDEDAGPAKLRSIHELRAAGKNRGFLQDTEAMLDDMINHDSTARGARRSAFLEIASKMRDKAFAERFIAHGFEQQIVSEFSAPPDAVGDFLFSAMTSLMLVGEPPQHTLTCLYKAGLLPWLLQQLSKDVDMRRVAGDRRNNMSKAAQTGLLAFVDTLRSHASFWEHAQPLIVTPRIVALKALELFIGRSRKLGDRSEMLAADELALVLGNGAANITQTSVADISLSVSVLESLAISTLIFTWPIEISRDVASILPSLQSMNGMPRHTIFLALRLSLNLTNDNARNCDAFAQAETIRYFLHELTDGFARLDSGAHSGDQRALDLDLLILSLGVMTNLADQNAHSRELTVADPTYTAPLLASLVQTFAAGQDRAAEAESMEETNTNVAFGYLAVLLANLCQCAVARAFIAARLPPDRTLGRLVGAVAEFVAFHEKVDLLQSMEAFEGEEGAEAYGVYTAKFRDVLDRLRAVA